MKLKYEKLKTLKNSCQRYNKLISKIVSLKLHSIINDKKKYANDDVPGHSDSNTKIMRNTTTTTKKRRILVSWGVKLNSKILGTPTSITNKKKNNLFKRKLKELSWSVLNVPYMLLNCQAIFLCALMYLVCQVIGGAWRQNVYQNKPKIKDKTHE